MTAEHMEAIAIANRQKTVRGCGKCLTVFGWIFMILGALTIFCNAVGFLAID